MNTLQRQELAVVLERLMTWRREWAPEDWQEARASVTKALIAPFVVGHHPIGPTQCGRCDWLHRERCPELAPATEPEKHANWCPVGGDLVAAFKAGTAAPSKALADILATQPQVGDEGGEPESAKPED